MTVNMKGDNTIEPDETFLVNLSGPTNAAIKDGQGIGTIRNDDGSGVAALGVTLSGPAVVRVPLPMGIQTQSKSPRLQKSVLEPRATGRATASDLDAIAGELAAMAQVQNKRPGMGVS